MRRPSTGSVLLLGLAASPAVAESAASFVEKVGDYVIGAGFYKQ